jgi:hypothetical protein
MTDKPLWRLPAASSGFEEGPVIKSQNDRLVLSYDYETPTGEYAWEDLVFVGVIAYRFVDDPSCRPDQIDAYDQLVEVGDSDWLRQLLAGRRYDASSTRHLRIYLDDVGCLEVAASDFEPPPDRAK